MGWRSSSGVHILSSCLWVNGDVLKCECTAFLMWNSVVLHNIKLGLGMFTVHYGHPDTLVTILLMLEMGSLCNLGMFVSLSFFLRSVIVGIIYATVLSNLPYYTFQELSYYTFLKTFLLIL